MISTVYQTLSGGQIYVNEIGGTCSTYWRDMHIGLCWGNLRKGGHLKDQGVERRIILTWIFKTWDMGH